MNHKTKKIVAGVLFGSFVIGASTPAFASTDVLSENSYYVGEANMNENIAPGAEQQGAAKHVIQAVKKVIVDYWDRIPLPSKVDFVRDRLLDALDYYFQFTDDVETAVRNAIYDVFPDANDTVVNIAVAVIMEMLPF